MRGLVLHLRARHVPVAVVVAVGTTTIAWLAWQLASETRQVGPPTTAVALMLAAVAASTTFAGADESLDRTAAISWPRARAVHLLIVFAFLVGLFAISFATPAQFGPIGFVVRNAAGLLGLTALAAVVLGPQRAWFVPVAWCIIALPYHESSTHHGMEVLTWMLEPVETRTSTVTAIVLAVVGAAAFVRGTTQPPRTEAL